MTMFDASFKILELIAYVVFMFNLIYLEERRLKKSIISIVSFFIIGQLLNIFNFFVILKIPILISFQSIILYFFLKVALRKSIYYSTLLTFLAIISEIFAVFILSRFNIWQEAFVKLETTLPVNQIETMVIRCLFLSIFFLITLIYSTATICYDLVKKIKICLLIIIIFVFQLSFFIMLDKYIAVNMINFNIVIICTAFCFLSTIVYILFTYDINLYFLENRHRMENEFLSEQNKQIMRYYKLANHNNETTQKLKHDFSNQIQCLNQLINTDIKKAQEFIQEIEDMIIDTNQIYTTGNPIVDTILTIKELEAKEVNIKTDITVGKIGDIIIADIDICNLLTNVLDNAIYANKKVDINNRNIKFKIASTDEYLVIKSSNNFDGKLIKQSKNILSSKRNYKNMGYGMKIINDIANKYNGQVSVTHNKNVFEITILLKISLKIY